MTTVRELFRSLFTEMFTETDSALYHKHLSEIAEYTCEEICEAGIQEYRERGNCDRLDLLQRILVAKPVIELYPVLRAHSMQPDDEQYAFLGITLWLGEELGCDQLNTLLENFRTSTDEEVIFRLSEQQCSINDYHRHVVSRSRLRERK